MDDLDHSMHIAEFDWSSFYLDSEECCLLQPTLARLDNLSDTDDPENSTPGSREVQLKTLHRDTSCVESSEEELKESSVQVQQEIQAKFCPEDSHTSVEEEEHKQTHRENSRQHSVSKTVSPDGQAVGEDGRAAERERWFVTVNSSPARPPPRGVVKKKRRPKNASKNRRVESCLMDRCEQEESEERRREEEERSCQGAQSDSEMEAEGAGGQPEDGSLTFIPSICSQEEGAGESQEVSSIHTCDSDSYFSAAESMGDTEHFPQEHPQALEFANPLIKESVLKQDVKPEHSHSAPCCQEAAAHKGRCECSNVGLVVTFPSADREIPDDFSSIGADFYKRSDEDISAAVSFLREEPRPGTDLTGTLRSTADGPDMCTEAVGQSRPVFAISAFWDEMEKLTINDILQLRRSENSPHSTVPESQTVNCNASSINHVGPAHNTLCTTPDVGLMDLSDTADSDYFTQPEESKPDCSGWDISTSDFEDEASGNYRNHHQGTTDFSFLFKEENFSEEDVESLSFEGRVTPVANFENASGQGFKVSESNTFSQWSRPGLMRKSKTMSDVRVLDGTTFTEPLCNSRLVFRTGVLEVSDSQDTLTSASNHDTDILEDVLPTFPDCFSLEDKSDLEFWCSGGPGPADLTVVPVLDHTLRDQVSFSVLLESLWNPDKPIPLFSCPQYIRGITVPKMDYCLLRTLDKVDGFLPVGALSGSLTQMHPYRTLATARCWTNRTLLTMNRFHSCEVLKDEHVPVVSSSSRVFSEPAAQHHIVELKETKGFFRGHKGVFSALQQSDMCLVCIAVASWVLTSSDPENVDAWKAALLANVSALSAIQYLRHYMKKQRPLLKFP